LYSIEAPTRYADLDLLMGGTINTKLIIDQWEELLRLVFFYRHGRVQDRSLAQQQRRAQGLNLVTAAIILWNTLELDRAVEELRLEGMTITPEQLAHLSPMDWEHINLTGDYVWDLSVKNPYAQQA
jgi:TnpA family transposase